MPDNLGDPQATPAGDPQATPAEDATGLYRVFEVVTIADLIKRVDNAEDALSRSVEVYLPRGTRQSIGRVASMNEQAQEDDREGTKYAAGAARNIQEHSPSKSTTWA